MASGVAFTTTNPNVPSAFHLVNGSPGRVHCGRPWGTVEQERWIVAEDPTVCGLCRHIAGQMDAELRDDLRLDNPNREDSC